MARASDAARRWRLLALLGLLLALALPVGAQDGGGGSWVERQLASLVPGLRIEGLRDPLSSTPGFARLTLSDANGVWLEIEDGSVAWTRLALLRRRLEIDSLSAARIAVLRLPVSDTPPDPGAAPGSLIPQLPSLPVDIRLDRARIGRLDVAEPVLGQPLALSLLGRLRLDAGGLDLGLDATLIEGGAVLVAEAALRPATGRLTARATLRGDPGG
ncbi:hypothetical protein, partial [Falsiroseomonas oryzae]